MEKENQKPSDSIMSNRAHLIFVYGTLRQGCGNHYLLDSSQFLGRAKTKCKCALYARGIPFLCRNETISQVVGEVYLVDDVTLNRLDQLEGHPTWYKREQAEVVLNDGRQVVAWIYFCAEPEGELIESGDFLEQRPPRRRQRSV